MKNKVAPWAPFVLCFLVIVSVAATQQAPAPIAIINLQVVMEQTPGWEQARDGWTGEMKGFESELEGMRNSLDSMIRAFDQQSVVLTPSARTDKQAELQQYQQRLAERAQALQTRSEERERELLAPLEERVQTVIEGLRAERNISVIFDVASEGNPIVSADRGLDLTQLVIDRLKTQG